MANVYLEGMRQVHNGAIDLLTGDIRVLLLTDATTPTFTQTSSFVADVLAEAGNTEATDATYLANGASGRVTLTGKVILETGGVLVELKADKVVWSSLDSFTVAAAVVFAQVTNDADSPVIAFFDFTDKAATGADFEIRWNGVDGVGRILALGNA